MARETFSIAAAYPEVDAGGFTRVDGTLNFYTRVAALLGEGSVLLDFGAGRGAAQFNDPIAFRRSLRMWRGRVARAVAVDVDPVVLTNPTVDDAALLDAQGNIPLPDQSVDIIVSDYVFEHIPDPAKAVAELSRVLKSGGWLCVRTPSRWSYVSILNAILPKRLAAWSIKKSQTSREEQDVFPAFYRLNTLRVLRRQFSGFDVSGYYWNSEPAYHADSVAILRTLKLVQTLSPPFMRPTLIAFMRKR